MAHPLVVLDGSTFFVSEESGDVDAIDAEGFFHADVRHLSLWRLLVDGLPMRLLSCRAINYYSARIFGTLLSAHVGENPPISIRREREVNDGVYEELLVENHSGEARRVRLELEYGSDFADIFEIKDRRASRKRGRTWTETGESDATLWYGREGFTRGTRLSFSAPCTVEEGRVTFDLRLEPRGRWATSIEMTCLVGLPQPNEERRNDPTRGTRQPERRALELREWLELAPELETDCDLLRHTYRQSLLDLAALRLRARKRLAWSVPAAGLPWFMALFGRDSAITAYQALPFKSELASNTLQALAAFQATDEDDFRDAQPGKILHELRHGELARFGDAPHSPYYGSHDATSLFLILLDEYERWTGDADLVRALEPSARAAVRWMEASGDIDGDGYQEYMTRSRKGLDNQCWKDSWDSMRFADGRMAELPIATCELQGYAYDARRRVARLARELWNDEEFAARLEADAAALREQFNRDYWSEERGHYVLALDGGKRQVDAMTSNVGHLLWSGIIDEARAGDVVSRLMAPDMFSGWGLRTMSTRDDAYSPIAYHNGTVWPHDTGIAAEGMRRYGYRDEASRLAWAVTEAADAFAYSLPEVFAGFDRAETAMPVEYPTASRPQAWTAGAPLLALRTMLGLDVGDGELDCSPSLPEPVRNLQLRGVVVRGERRTRPGPD